MNAPIRLLQLLLLALLPMYGAQFAVPMGHPPPHTQSLAAPAAVPRPYRVGLQVGHYKNNELPSQLSRLEGSTGTRGGGRTEVDLNFDVATRVATLLRAKGVQVDVLPATVPTGYSADAFIAIHADGASSSSPRGFKISTRWRSEVAKQDARLVEVLTAAYQTATGLPEDSNVTRNMRGYYAYSPTRPNYRTSNFTPGAIVEMGFMTNAKDRAVMFNTTDKVASGIVTGIMNFLKEAYPQTRATHSYGYGIIDDDIDPDASSFRNPGTPRSNGPSAVVSGDWQIMPMGKATINVYSAPGGGSVLAKLPRGQFYRSLARKGDYYSIILPNGKEGWVHRNAIVVQM